MNRAISLAQRGEGLVSPNPPVGAVIVSEGRIVGEGFHRYDLLKHAESYATEMAGARARGATLYCSLEPCCHYGRTPPCTDALIEAGIARAVIAMEDPDRRVSGKGIEQLRKAGIRVEVGLREHEARRVAEAYLKHITTGTPFIHGVINRTENLNWQPSERLIEIAAAYDAIALGEYNQANILLAQYFLARPRHRLPIVICAHEMSDYLQSINRSAVMMKVDESSAAREQLTDSSPFALQDDTSRVFTIESGLSATLAALSRLRATSLLIMPRSKAVDEKSIIESSDRLTVVSRSDERIEFHNSMSFDLNEGTGLEVTDSVTIAETLEITGYTKRTER